jgi:hypothetical protein
MKSEIPGVSSGVPYGSGGGASAGTTSGVGEYRRSECRAGSASRLVANNVQPGWNLISVSYRLSLQHLCMTRAWYDSTRSAEGSSSNCTFLGIAEPSQLDEMAPERSP